MKGPEQYYLEQDFWELEEESENFSELEKDFVEKYIGLEMQSAEETEKLQVVEESEELQAVEEIPISQEVEKIEEIEKSDVVEETKPDRPRLLDILQKAVRTVEKSDSKKTAVEQSDGDVAETDLLEAGQEDGSAEQVEEVQTEQFKIAENVEITEAEQLGTVEAEQVETAKGEAVEIEEQSAELEDGTEIVTPLDTEDESADFAAVEEVVKEAAAEENEIVAAEEMSEVEALSEDLSVTDLAESEIIEAEQLETAEDEISETVEADLLVNDLEQVEAAAISETDLLEAGQEDVAEVKSVEEVQVEQLEIADAAQITEAEQLETVEIEQVETAKGEAVETEEQSVELEDGTEIVTPLGSESESADFAAVEEVAAEESEIVASEEISEVEPLSEDLSAIDLVENEVAELGEFENAEIVEAVEAEHFETVAGEAVEIAEDETSETAEADLSVSEPQQVETAVISETDLLEAGQEDGAVTEQVEETQTEQLEIADAAQITEAEQSQTVATEQVEIAEAEAVEADEIEEIDLPKQDFGLDLPKDKSGAVEALLPPLEIIEAENMPTMDRQEEKIVESVVLEEKPIDEEILIGEDALQVGQNLFSNEEEVQFSGATDVVERLKAREELQFVSFKVCEQEFVLPIDCVQEVVNYVEPSRIPSKSEYIAGVTPLRGRITPLIRMDRLIKKKTLDTNFKFIAVCRFDGLQVGLIIHSVATIYRVKQEQIDWKFAGKNDLVCGVVKLKEELVGILAIDRVMKHTVD